MQLDLLKLFQPAYLFTTAPSASTWLVPGLMIFFIVLLFAAPVVAIVLGSKAKKDRLWLRIRTKSVRWLVTVGLVGLVLGFFRLEAIPYFAMRIWLVLWLVAAVIWLVTIIRYLLKKFPEERILNHERLTRERYLPKPKKGTSR